MVLGFYKNKEGKIEGGLFDTHEQFYKATFSPLCEVLFFWNFKTKGKTYDERKDYLEQIAVNYSITEKPDLYIGEIAFIEHEFYRLGKSYGLLQEFRENCIC